MSNTDLNDFLGRIDWTLLREQKIRMIEVINDVEEAVRQTADADLQTVDADLTAQASALEGILNLLDALQDHAADVVGIDGVFAE